MYELFTVHVWMATAGGSFGALRSYYDSHNVKRPVGERITDFFISIIAAVSFTSYVFVDDAVHPLVYLGVGAFAGASARMVLRISTKGLAVFMKSKIDGFFSAIATAIVTSQNKHKDQSDVNKE